MSTVSLVPCMCWVRKGVAKEIPDKVQLSAAEIQQLLRDAQDQLEGLALQENQKGGDSASVADGDQEGGVKENNGEPSSVDELYDLEHYDSDGEKEGEKMSGAGMGNGLAGLTYYASNEDDPYITLKNVPLEDDEREDERILPTDNLLVVGRADEEFSSLEVHVYSELEDHVYSHHEVLLTAFPLALEWMDFDPEQPDKIGNYLAVGSMSPAIEVWDLDMVDGLEPVFTLGDPSSMGTRSKMEGSKGGKKKKKKKLEAAARGGEENSHCDAVLGLSWNRVVRSILASASADCSVRVWDMVWPKCALTIPHPDKVQCLQWHPYEPELLATGGYDRVVRLFNCKSPERPMQRWKVGGEVEKVLWNHFQPELLLAGTDKMVWCLHKTTGEVVFQIHAHDETVSDLSLSCHIPGLLVTASTDSTVKFWDVHENAPVFLLSKDLHMGAILCAKFCVDSPYTLAVGGQKNGFHMLNVARMPAVAQRFKERGLMIPVIPQEEGTSGSTMVPQEERTSGSTMVPQEEGTSGSTMETHRKLQDVPVPTKGEDIEATMETEKGSSEGGGAGGKGGVAMRSKGSVLDKGSDRGVVMKPGTVAARKHNRKKRKH